jgi:hypothetical protein
MGKLRCDCSVKWASLAALAILVTSCALPPSGNAVAKAAEETVVLRNLESPGAVEIENKGSAISLWSQMRLQRFENGEWHEEKGLDLVIFATCEWNRPPGCQPVEHGAKVRPVPWNGLSCGGQCGASCRANVFLGPGKFRFVASSCDQKHRFYGPAFTMPDYDHSELKKSGK